MNRAVGRQSWPARQPLFPHLCVLVLLILLALPGPAASAGTLSIVGDSRWVDVGRILDGDTFVTKAGEHVRLLGINAPEIAHENSPAQAMGYTATKALTKLIAGKSVRMEFDVQRKDAYGRTLAQIYLRDGTWVNGEMVKLGMAHAYTFTPNLHWAAKLIALEVPARAARLGIWSTRRFAVLDAATVNKSELGQFHVVRGKVSRISRNRFAFYLDRLHITVPRRYRPFFDGPPALADGNRIVVHGVVRGSRSGLFLALHSPFDVEKISP